MFLHAERPEDIIAHFIGQFQIDVEQARLRQIYEEFRHQAAEDPDPEQLDDVMVLPLQTMKIAYYQPGVIHDPSFWHPVGWGSGPHYALPNIEASPLSHWAGSNPVFYTPLMRPHHHNHDGADQAASFIPPPGQVILVLRQAISLIDNDTFVIGDGTLPPLDPNVERLLDHLMAQALAFHPDFPDMPHSTDAIGQFALDAAEVLQHAVVTNDALVAHGDMLSGTYVDGIANAIAPDLARLLPAPFQHDDTAPAQLQDHASLHLNAPPETLNILEAGANLFVNTVAINNSAMMAGVMAVAGDVHQIDAIIQSNALSDIDRGMSDTQLLPSPMHNVASFSNAAPGMPGLAEAIAGAHPMNWSVSVIEGDAVFMQWVVQITFASDNDRHSLSDTGSNSTVTTGGNIGQNIFNFADLGNYYDLIIVGGNLYDINMIIQANVLLDNDTMTGSGSHAQGGGNLLYNGANIGNVGGTNWLDGLPSHYLEALTNIPAGRYDMPGGFAADPAFAGMGHLSVLVITGNVYDLRFVSQLNVVGDADQIARAEQAVIDASLGRQWQIDTGSNALINYASITDVDTLSGVGHVGGHHYSDAVLIQANILTADHGFGGDVPLANEVIAFLDSDDIFAADDGGSDGGYLHSMDTSLDAMNSILT